MISPSAPLKEQRFAGGGHGTGKFQPPQRDLMIRGKPARHRVHWHKHCDPLREEIEGRLENTDVRFKAREHD